MFDEGEEFDLDAFDVPAPLSFISSASGVAVGDDPDSIFLRMLSELRVPLGLAWSEVVPRIVRDPRYLAVPSHDRRVSLYEGLSTPSSRIANEGAEGSNLEEVGRGETTEESDSGVETRKVRDAIRFCLWEWYYQERVTDPEELSERCKRRESGEGDLSFLWSLMAYEFTHRAQCLSSSAVPLESVPLRHLGVVLSLEWGATEKSIRHKMTSSSIGETLNPEVRVKAIEDTVTHFLKRKQKRGRE